MLWVTGHRNEYKQVRSSSHSKPDPSACSNLGSSVNAGQFKQLQVRRTTQSLHNTHILLCQEQSSGFPVSPMIMACSETVSHDLMAFSQLDRPLLSACLNQSKKIPVRHFGMIQPRLFTTRAETQNAGTLNACTAAVSTSYYLLTVVARSKVYASCKALCQNGWI